RSWSPSPAAWNADSTLTRLPASAYRYPTGAAPMTGMIELVASDGFKLSAYRADPPGKPRGGLVVIQEIFGVNSHIRSVCDGYAADGYLAIAPALFDRYEPKVDLGYTPDHIARGRDLRGRAGADEALADIAAARDVA